MPLAEEVSLTKRCLAGRISSIMITSVTKGHLNSEIAIVGVSQIDMDILKSDTACNER